jgi:hypothetical protein
MPIAIGTAIPLHQAEIGMPIALGKIPLRQAEIFPWPDLDIPGRYAINAS